jgi:hypothetical protein
MHTRNNKQARDDPAAAKATANTDPQHQLWLVDLSEWSSRHQEVQPQLL